MTGEATTTSTHERATRYDDTLTTVLLCARVALVGLFLAEILRGNVGGPNVFRFRQIALSHGTPWRDFPVEYAPGDWLLIRILFAASPIASAFRLAILALAADVGAFLGVRWGWGRRAGLLYLFAGFPLVTFVYQRDDLVGVALAVWGLALAKQAWDRAGGLTVAAAAMVKVWALVLLPVVWLQGRIRSLVWAAASIAIATVVWLAVAGTAGPNDVLTFRGATGWQVESPIGWFVWTISGDRPTLQQGAYRVGSKPGWVAAILGIALVIGIATGARRERRRPIGDPAGLPALAAVAWLLLLSPTFSTQYVTWLLPWAAVAGVEEAHGRPAFLLAVVASFSTSVVDTSAGFSTAIVFRLAVLVRNLAVLACVLLWLVADPKRTGVAASTASRTAGSSVE